MSQTIFTVLGLLDEYSHRKIARGNAEVERFYPSEEAIADLFEAYLRQLADEHNLQTEIRREKVESGHIYFYSEELNDLICSYYIKAGLTDVKADEIPQFFDDKGFIHYGHGRIGESMFPAKKHHFRLTEAERQPRLAFLCGAYARYGKENIFRFGNACHKARLIERLLLDLGCCWLRFTTSLRGFPTLMEIEFEMTAEMKQHFVSYKKA